MIDYRQKAKIDYSTGFYCWFELRAKYYKFLGIEEIFQIIELVRKEKLNNLNT